MALDNRDSMWFYAKHISIGLTDDPRDQSEIAFYLTLLAHVLLSCYQLRVPWACWVALVEHARKGKKHAEKAALRLYLHNIKLKMMLN